MLKILVADDSDTIRTMVSFKLKSCGYEVVTVEDGLEVINNVESINPDLIMLDVSMPNMNGFEVASRLRASPTTQNIPIIFLTAMADTEDVLKGLGFGAIDYITKPFKPEILVAKVCNHLNMIKSRKEITQTNEQLKQENKGLEEKAVTDGLTGLYNHNFIIERLSQEIARCNRYKANCLSIFMFDLDHFKAINDNYGHLVGDEVLVRVSAEIKRLLREVDILGRYGGEEFLVLLPDTSLENACVAAEKIRERVATLNWSAETLKVALSGGVCAFNGEDAIELIKKTDILLYLAKRNGRNRIEC